MVDQALRDDFDRIAKLPSEKWDHNSHYHSFLLRHLPSRFETGVDVGCGHGRFTRLMASRANDVVGIDISPEMVKRAEEQSSGISSLRFHIGNFVNAPITKESVDVVASIATLHHAELKTALTLIRRWLRPTGRLIVLDLFDDDWWPTRLLTPVTKAVSISLSFAHERRLKHSPEVQRLWEQHVRADTYMPLSEIRRVAAAVLPGSIVRRHLLRRYSLIWEKPGGK